MACAVDLDCAGNLVCYAGVGWLPEGTESLCGCSSYWGWTGADCTGLTTQTAGLIALAVFVGTAALVALGYNVQVVVEIVRLDLSRRWEQKNATLAFTSIALLGLVGWRALTFSILITPYMDPTDLGITTEKFHPLLPVEKTFVAVTVVFATLSAISVSVAWIDLAKKSNQLLPASRAGAFADHRCKVWAFGGLFCVSIAIASAMARTEIAVISAVPFIIVILISFIVGQRRMLSLISLMGEFSSESGRASGTTSGNTKRSSFVRRATGSGSAKTGARRRRTARKQYLTLLNKVKRTSRLVILSLTLTLAASMAYAIPEARYGWKEVCPLGESVCPIALANEFISLTVLCLVLAVQQFLRDSFLVQFSRRRRERSESAAGASSSNNVKRPSFMVGTDSANIVTASPRTGLDLANPAENAPSRMSPPSLSL